jgi:hypothetical protein
MITDRFDLIVLARVATTERPTSALVASATRRFAPSTVDAPTWTKSVEQALERMRDLDARAELERRLKSATWKRLAEQTLPAISLGLDPSDKSIDRLAGRDQWTAAIAGRALGLWTNGAPPSLSAVCDAYAWKCLALPGRPKRCPPEIRATFLQRELRSDLGPPDRLLRLYVARELGAARPELRVLRDALVTHWLLGKQLGVQAFAEDVRSAARSATSGAFGQRKVFISAVWDQLHRSGRWSSLTLEDFKRRLLDEHRSGSLELSRADLVSAMDPRLVAASETLADGASFHFIVREGV